jgi:hypothetical protein
MTKAKTPAIKKNDSLKVYTAGGDTLGLATAKAILAPHFRHAVTVSSLNKTQFGDMDGGGPGFGDYNDALWATSKRAVDGDLAWVSSMLAAQAVTLDNVFTELARRMAMNMGQHINATDTYARHAMKAQAQSRATLEALANLHRPREQTVRHVHVGQGGQAVVADQFHHHGRGGTNADPDEQSHATGAAGAIPALPCQDPFGNGVPIPGGEREEAMPDAWRD